MTDANAIEKAWAKAQPARAPVVVIVLPPPFTVWNYRRFGFETFQRLGIEALHVDSEAFETRAFRKTTELCGILDIGDPEALRERLAGRASVALTSVDLSAPSLRPLAAIFKDLNVPWCRALTALIPPAALPELAADRARYYAFKLLQVRRREGLAGTLRLVGDWLHGRTVASLRPKRSTYAPRYVLAGGTAWPCVLGPGATVIPGHSQDYELARAEGLLAPGPAENICVFIDSNETAHPDFGLHGIRPADLPDADWYFAALRRSFAAIEAATKLRVVVLLHPRTKAPAELFGPYELWSGDTLKSVARAKLVLGHYSTALGLAPLFDKPLVLLTAKIFSRLMGGQVDSFIRGFQHALGCQTLSMDDPDLRSLDDWSRIDRASYASYRAHYLRHPDAAEGSVWANALSFIARDRGWVDVSGGQPPKL